MAHSNRRSFLAATAASIWAANVAAGNARAAQRIKVGQIGTKHAHASGKLETIRKFPEIFDVIGVVEDDAEQKARVAATKSFQDLPWMTQEQLLNVPDLQLVLVETDIDNLLSVAELCISAGKHIHLDKPAGTSLTHFQKICAAADSKQLALQMGYMFRGNPAFRFLFQAVREGWLGDIFQIHGEISKKVDDATRHELARYRGGAMFELGCHLLDAVVTILGKPKSVTAVNSNTRAGTDNLMDNCLAVLRYDRAAATIKSSVCEVDGTQRRQFVVCGTLGTISIQPLEPAQLMLTLEKPTATHERGTHQVALPASTGRYDGDLLHLAAVIRGDAPPEFNTAHDLAVQEAVLAASEMPLSGK